MYKSIFILLFFPLICYSQAPKIQLNLGPQSIIFKSEYRPDVIDAFTIASTILSSPQFQQAMMSSSFVYPNHCLTCKILNRSRKERIPGQTVIDSLFKHPAATLNLDLEENEPKDALGSTCPSWDNNNFISRANFNVISDDMKELSFKYSLAVNICHEYMHFIGFCHPDDIDDQPDDNTPAPIAYRDDVAYKAGWVAYFIAVKMEMAGLK